jgi:hypothetical protein
MGQYADERQPRQACESHAHRIRSAAVKRRRGRRDRWTTASWCRSAMISRCSDARDRMRNRSGWSSETTTDDTPAGYRRMPATSIDATRTKFSVATAAHGSASQARNARRVSTKPNAMKYATLKKRCHHRSFRSRATSSDAIAQFVTVISPAMSASRSTRNPRFGAIISSQLW